jgi:hypothetical protein
VRGAGRALGARRHQERVAAEVGEGGYVAVDGGGGEGGGERRGIGARLRQRVAAHQHDLGRRPVAIGG